MPTDGDPLVVPVSGTPGLYIHLGRLLYERRMSLAEFSRRIGIKDDNVRVLRDGGSKAIRFRNMAAICEVLECQPGDLMTYEPPDHDGP